MQKEGPVLESLTHRLTETPEEFLSEPRIGVTGRAHVSAVVGDLLRILNVPAAATELSRFSGGDVRKDRNRLSVTLILCWLLSGDWFRQTHLSPGEILGLLDAEANELSLQIPARKFVMDADRREELVRVALSRLGYRPAGETVAQAQDRLTTLNSAERARVIKAARAAEERARQIREALVKKAAQESADKWGRE